MSLTGAAVALAVLAAGAAQQPPPPAPAAAPAVRFAVKGDWGWGGPEQAAVTRRMCGEYRRAPFRFVAHDRRQLLPARRRRDHGQLHPPGAVPPHARRRRGTPRGATTTRPARAPRRRSTRRGGTTPSPAGPVRLLVLDGNDPADPAQLAFIRRQLTARPRAGPDRRPPPAAAHRRAPPAVRGRPAALGAALPARARCTLVLQGHNHAYERFRIGALTYITTGGGRALYPCVRPADGHRSAPPGTPLPAGHGDPDARGGAGRHAAGRDARPGGPPRPRRRRRPRARQPPGRGPRPATRPRPRPWRPGR